MLSVSFLPDNYENAVEEFLQLVRERMVAHQINGKMYPMLKFLKNLQIFQKALQSGQGVQACCFEFACFQP